MIKNTQQQHMKNSKRTMITRINPVLELRAAGLVGYPVGWSTSTSG
jgi:hypothetical protein